MASELNSRACWLKVRQETKHPEEATSRLLLTCEQPGELNLRIRHRWWAVSGLEIRVNRGESFRRQPGRQLRDGGPDVEDGRCGGSRPAVHATDGIATQKTEQQPPDKFCDEVHPLPEKLTQGKERITGKFQAHPDDTAGGVRCRTMRMK